MWYETEEEAKKACKRKEVEFGEEFAVQKDSEQPNCWWATRKSALK